ncbi:MAG: hypothetical protein AAF731_14190 [Bacteroidota bacterium]
MATKNSENMSNNTFNGRRFGLLFKQHFIHNNKLLLYSTVAYVGVVFLLLSIVQVGSELVPHDLENFRGFLLGFTGVFGVLYAGYSFPAFRAKESSMNYLMVPGSVLEKFLFELVSRLGLILILLPFLFWITFHLQGYFFDLFSRYEFKSIGLSTATSVQLPNVDSLFWFTALIFSAVLLGFVVPFTGAAMFTKQPLIKTLFSVALLVIFYTTYTYLVAEELGVNKYGLNDSMWLIPTNEAGAFQFFAIALVVANVVLLFVAYRKLREKEV